MGSAVQKIPMSRAVNGISGSVNTESPARIISGTSTRSGIIIVRISVHAIRIRTTARHRSLQNLIFSSIVCKNIL